MSKRKRSDSSSSPGSSTSARRFDSLEQEVFLNLWRTYDRLRALEDKLFGKYELTPQQYNVLRLLRGVHPETLPTLTLAGKLVSRSPDITRMLDKLLERGLVERHRPPENRRVVQIKITPGGLKLLKTLDEKVRECHFRQLGHLPDKSQQDLIRLLKEARGPHEDHQSPWG